MSAIPAWLVALGATILIFGGPLIWFQNQVERRHLVYATVLAVAFFIFSVLVSILWDPTKDTSLIAIGGFCASLLVTVGWIVSNEVAIANSRRQHTMTMLSSYYTNKERREDLNIVRAKIPHPTKLTPQIAAFDMSGDPFNQALDRTLGFLEFIAAAIEQRDIDERLARETISGSFVGLYTQCADYIYYWRFEARDADRETWINVCRVYNRWRSPGAPKAKNC